MPNTTTTPTVYEGWWRVPAGPLLASHLAAIDLPRIPGLPDRLALVCRHIAALPAVNA